MHLLVAFICKVSISMKKMELILDIKLVTTSIFVELIVFCESLLLLDSSLEVFTNLFDYCVMKLYPTFLLSFTFIFMIEGAVSCSCIP